MPRNEQPGRRRQAWAPEADLRLRRALAKYAAMLRTQLTNALAYPADLAARSLMILLFLWVFVQLWRATYRAAGQSSIAGLTLRQTLWYLMLAETIVLSRPRLSGTIATAVKDGSIAYLLNKPYDFMLYQLSVTLGDSALRLLGNALAGGALIWLLVGPPLALWGWPLVVVTVGLAWLIDFCLDALIGLAAFVTEEVTAFEWIYQKLVFILGGLLIPLDFFPTWLRAVAERLPFAYALYGPARLFVEPSLARFGALVAGQAGWLLAVGMVLFLVYRRGLARLTINGG